MSATCSPALDPTLTGPAAPAEIDRSCRWPVLLLFGLAACWLVIGSVFSLLVSLKFHVPGLLADSAWLTYGRLQPAATNAFLYGFAVPASLGMALWLGARLGGVPLRLPGLAVVGALVWNVGLKLGLLGILGGDSTGFEWLELPRYASPILFAGYTLVGVSALQTFRARRAGELYVSQWFLLAALFAFPWIFSTAHLLVSFVSLRGVMPAVVTWWYGGHVITLWLGFVGLAAVFYLLPKLLGGPLFSRYHALFAFWVLALFGGWTQVPQSAPLPAWMPALSTVANLFVLVAAVAVVLDVRRTLVALPAPRSRFPLSLVNTSVVAYALANLLNATAALPSVAAITDFTLFTPARTQLFVYGFFGLAMFAGMYHVLPRVLGFSLPSARLIKTHAVCALAGLTISVVALTLGGVLQGLALNRPEIAFLDTLRPGLMALRLGTLGDVLLLAGHVALLLNLVSAFLGWGLATWKPVVVAAMRPEAPEVAR
jgi:cytochrome c oxidase cbb3-type subunit 1